MNINSKDLVAAAESARLASYSPYSNFAVGAALLCADGTVYKGCNIENASFTPTCCAERVAIFKAVSEGRRDFVAIAVVGGKVGESERGACYPCGVCRQVLAEFCPPDFIVLTYDANEKKIEKHRLSELLPKSFSL